MNMGNSRSGEETITFDHLKMRRDICITVTQVSKKYVFHWQKWKEPEIYFKWSISSQKYTANSFHSFHLPKNI